MLTRQSRPILTTRGGNSKMEFHSPLNDSRVATRRSDAAEIARVDDRSGNLIHSGVIEVADGVGKIHIIHQVEEFGAELRVMATSKLYCPGPRRTLRPTLPISVGRTVPVPLAIEAPFEEGIG